MLFRSYPDGLRGFLATHEHEACEVDVRDKAVLLDMDTQEDYRRLLDYLNRSSIPELDQCWQILSEARVDEKIEKHCFAVACTALDLVGRLNSAGAGLDEKLVLAAALLHDIARREPDHALAGARLLETRGYPLVAAVVGPHMDIDVSEERPLTESEVVYYADKIVRGNTLVSINDRFGATLRKFKDDPQASEAVLNRMRQAERIKKKMEAIGLIL